MKKPDLVLTGEPNPKQVEFFKATARHICYGGARGGGKSWALRRKFLLLAMAYPNLKLLILRRTMPELRENIIIPYMAEIGKFAQFKATENVFIFPNGSRIKMGYCDSEMDVYQFQGQEYDVIGLEEATHFTETQKNFITTCNRSVRSDITPRMYYTCNPGNVGHEWVKRLFVTKKYTEEEDPKDYVFIPAKVTDNTILMERDPGYVKELRKLPEHQRRAHLDGDWDALEGQFFAEWRRDKHVCEPFTIPASWKRFRAMDWGYNDPCCCLWFAVSPDKHIYVYDEYYRRARLAVDVAKSIKEKTGTVKCAYTAASPDMWQKRGMQTKTHDGFVGESIAELFQKGGVPLQKADNSRVIGWQRVREYLADAPDGIPWLQVFPCCENLIEYMPMMQYDDTNKEDAKDGNDHAPEALRYGLMTRATPMKEQKEEEKYQRVIPFDPFNERTKERKSSFLAL